jgi:DNA replication and repair protein RecF
MAILDLEITNFRCFQHEVIEFDEVASFFAGPNGAGKTSILEAIYLLSCGRSFRVNDRRNLCSYGARTFTIRSNVTTGASQLQLELSYGDGALQVKVADTKSRGFADIASLMPVRVIDSSSHLLVEGPPVERRRFIDWGVFHVEPDYVKSWRAFQRSLKQRNAALKAHASEEEIEAWDEEFCRLAERVSSFRHSYLRGSIPYLAEAALELVGRRLDLQFRSGWTGDSLELALRVNRRKDAIREVTTSGPHRADLMLLFDGRSAAETLSRGQQKMLAAALILGQIRYAASFEGPVNMLLIDDPAAELDADNLEKLNNFIGHTPAQLILTHVKPRTQRLFHVEQGHVRAVV